MVIEAPSQTGQAQDRYLRFARSDDSRLAGAGKQSPLTAAAAKSFWPSSLDVRLSIYWLAYSSRRSEVRGARICSWMAY